MTTVRFDSQLDAPTQPLAESATPSPILRFRTGKLFEIGDYPDKDFTLSAEEADAAIQDFTPCEADLEHRSTVLDGNLGRLVKVWRQGTELFGTAEVPDWLDQLLEGTERKISLAWSRVTKRIVGWSWVLNPRVNDAALMAAFAATEEFAGRRHSLTDQTAIQEIHDVMINHGAQCSMPGAMGFAGQRHSQHDIQNFQHVHDLVVRLGATCPTPPPVTAAARRTESKEHTMANFFKDLKQWVNLGMPAEFEAGEGTTDAATVTQVTAPATTQATWAATPVTLSSSTATLVPPVDLDKIRRDAAEAARTQAEADFAAEQAKWTQQQTDLQAQIAAEQERATTLNAQLAEQRATRIASEGTVFTNNLVTSGRILPKHRARVLALYCSAAQDDMTNPVEVTFSTEAGTETKASRLDTLCELLNDLDPHDLTTDFSTAQVLVTPNAQPGESANGITPERRAALLRLTTLGEKTLGSK